MTFRKWLLVAAGDATVTMISGVVSGALVGVTYAVSDSLTVQAAGSGMTPTPITRLRHRLVQLHHYTGLACL